MTRSSTCIVLRASVCVAIIAAAEPGALLARSNPLDALPTNKWQAVYDGQPGIIAVHSRFIWLAETKAGLIWPNYNYRSKRYNFDRHAQLHFFWPEQGKWTARPGSFPEAMKVDPQVVGLSCVYLPGIKRVLFLQTGGDRRRKKTAGSWLLDPATCKWTALTHQPRMCDLSSEFNPARGADGSPVPLWGALVYAAGTAEAVCIGGGGTWGRVGKEKEKVSVGDWIYDEAAEPKRIRRLTAKDEGSIAEARKWYPANCGTWTFSQRDLKWTPIAQPLGQQPSGRILPGAAYDAGADKIVLFGGDDLQRCLRDTWIYDCKSRTWSKAHPEVSPPARAGHAMVYVPDQRVVLLAGGYGPGWVKRSDVWVYRTAADTWTRLGLDLPAPGRYLSADHDPASGAILLSVSNPRWGMNNKTLLLGLKLELDSAPKAPAAAKADPASDYHCKGKSWSAPLPREWRSRRNAPGDPQAGRRELAALPANTWVLRNPPMKVRARQWGKYVYDARTHRGYAWGGGHFGYIGADVSEYDLLRNRWRSMDDPVNYKLPWRHPSGGGSPGVSFQGWRLMGTHARKSYGVDPLSDSVITLHGDVFSIAANRFVGNIGRSPGTGGLSDQEAYVTAPHGLYNYRFDKRSRSGLLHRANVAAGKWDLIARGGPAGHREYDTLCHDARRDRLVYVKSADAAVWTFDFKTNKWSRETPLGKAPKSVAGDTTYVHDMDAVMMVFAAGKTAPPRLYFYKLGEKRWYTAPYEGARVGWFGNLNNSPHYDPDLKLFVRLTHFSRDKFVEVLVMRLDVQALKLTRIE